MYLLGLSNLIPTQKLLKKLAKINPKWDCAREDPYVKQYLAQDSDAEEGLTLNDVQVHDN